MQQDLDLIRQIVLDIEDMDFGPAGISIEDFGTQFKIDGYTPEQVEYHYGIVHDRGLLRTRPQCKIDLLGLSSAGHDFADSVRDDEIWAKTKNGA